MNDLKVFHRTGAFDLAVVVLTWVQFLLWLIGGAPSADDGAAFGQHVFAIKNLAFTQVIAGRVSR